MTETLPLAEERRIRIARRSVAAAGAVVTIGGAISFLGWLLDIARLADWVGSGIAIQPNSAVAATVSGFGLLALSADQRRAASTLGALVAGIGIATLIEHATGMAIGIDSVLLFGRRWGMAGAIVPGRVGLPGSVSWALVGLALLLSVRPAAIRRRIPTMGIIIAGIALLAIVGYLFDASTLYTLPRLTTIALQTAAMLFVTGLGLVASAGDEEPMRTLLADSSAGILARRTLPFVVLLPIVVGYLRLEGERARWYDTAMGSALLVLSLVVMICTVLWRGVTLVNAREEALVAADEARRRSDAALRATELRVVETLEQLADGFITLDRDWRFTYANAEAERVYSTRRSQLIGLVIWEAFPQLLGSVLHRSLVQAAASRTMIDFEDFNPRTGRWYANRTHPSADGGLSVFFRDVTDAKRVGERAFRSEELARALLGSLPGSAVFVVDHDLRYLVADGEAIRSAGFASNALIGKTLTEIGDAERIARFEPLFRTALQGTPFSHEHEYRDRWYVTRGVPLRNERNEIYAALVFSLDITDRKVAEQALRDSRALVIAFLDQLPVGVGLVDTQGNYLLSNPILTKFVGGIMPSADTAEQHRWQTWAADGSPLPPDEWPGVRSLRGESVRPGMEFLQIHDDGTECWRRVSGTPFRNEAGEIVGAISVIEDIDAQKRAEEKLRETHALIEAVSAGTPDLIFAKDREGRVTYYNEATRRVIGIPLSEILGRTEREFIGDTTFTRQLMENDRRVMESGVVESVEETFSDGRIFLITKAPLRDSTGKVIGITGVGVDATELKRVQAELNEADRRKDDFLATLAHELRNPLAPVSNSLEIMRRADGNRALTEQARETMQRQVSHMVRLIDDLLDLSRITRDRLELRHERVEVASLVHYAVEACRSTIERAGLELRVSMPDEPIYVNGDPVRLSQVLGNLIYNACKYTDAGGHLGITAARSGGTAIISVSDTGLGIPPQMLDQVFEMFAQVDRTLDRSRGGLGIGLALARRLVEMHHGTIVARSEGLDRGSEFSIRLPALVGAIVEPPAPASLPDAPIQSERRILVVDDNRDSAASLADLLQLYGVETRVAHDGLEALETAATFLPDAILLDIGMPRMNGYEACRAIRKEPWGDRVLIVALTGWGQDADRARSKEAGFDEHLVKPVDPQILMKLLASRSVPR